VGGRTASLTYTVKIPTEDEVYIYFPSDWAREVDLSLNGEDHGTYFGNETRRIVSLGTFLPGELITLQMTLTEEDLYIGTGVDYFYYLDEALYAEIMPRLQAYAMQVTEWKDTRIVGQVTTDADHSLIYTSIPYDEGWNVTVDGEAVEIVRVCGALLAVDVSDLPEGEHTVELSYMPKCYVYAFILSMGGILLLILCMAIRISVHKLKERNREIRLESVAPDAPDAPVDGETACIPLAELLAEVEAERAVQNADAAESETDIAGDSDGEDTQKTDSTLSEQELELTPEEADAVLRDLFPEDVPDEQVISE
jgi:hypothetical protein